MEGRESAEEDVVEAQTKGLLTVAGQFLIGSCARCARLHFHPVVMCGSFVLLHASAYSHHSRVSV